MKKSLLITGITGFVGRHLLEKLNGSSYDTVFGLSREPENFLFPDKKPKNLKIIRGDLSNPESYKSVLSQVDTVVHLAAVTGKAPRNTYRTINTLATRDLLEACQESGVRHFLLISSIAVKFTRNQRYFYAHSKLQAEDEVRKSKLSYTILRPTIILGAGSPVFNGFSRFIGLPLIPIFGKGRERIQPVHVSDVAEVIRYILDNALFKGEIIELGGNQVLTIKDFMKQMASRSGTGKSRFLHVPLGPMVLSLLLTEPLLYPVLPFTLGQLATFRNDGLADSHATIDKLSSGFQDVAQMVDDSFLAQESDGRRHELEEECRIFCRYLIGQQADSYVTEKYVDVHRKIALKASNKFDRILAKLGAKNRILTRMCDSYSRFFYPMSLLRKKLAYLLAILETASPYAQTIDRSDNRGKFLLILIMGFKGMAFAFFLLSSFALLFPLQVLFKSKKTGDVIHG
jgi:NADH dehydrogenase